MRRDLQPSDLGDLLELPLVAVLATYRRDGSVLLAPVWHRWRDGGFDISTNLADVKVRNLRRDPRASILVYEHVPPYRGIELRTEPALLTEGQPETGREIAVHYLGSEEGEAWAAGAEDDVVLRLEPGVVRAWDFSDDFS